MGCQCPTLAPTLGTGTRNEGSGLRSPKDEELAIEEIV